jgi:hypothetical protein
MDKKVNPFIKKCKSFPSNSTTDRWNRIKEEVQIIERNNMIERRSVNKFKNYNNRDMHYSKFMRFTEKKEIVEEKKPEFDLDKMKDEFPQLSESN